LDDWKQVFTFICLQTCQECIGIIGINLGKPKYNNAEIWFKFDPTGIKDTQRGA
jgi:hypothetical protein